jgi:hypothetical protein
MKARVALIAMFSLTASATASADGGTSCATAQQIFGNVTYSGDTSTSTNWVGAFGGLPSPGPDLAFKYTGLAAPSDPIFVTIIGGWNAGAVITATCGGNGGNPIQAATGTNTFLVPTTGLTPGAQYYFYMTGNPSDSSGPSGAFSFSTTTPVTLQTFSVD